jgi:hypothetical protein
VSIGFFNQAPGAGRGPFGVDMKAIADELEEVVNRMDEEMRHIGTASIETAERLKELRLRFEQNFESRGG